MSMIWGTVTLSDENIERVLSDPPLIWQVIAPDDPEAYEEARREQPKPSWFARIFAKKREPAGLTLSENEGRDAGIDKAWHGLHFLLTQSAWEGSPPENFLVSGGTVLEGIDAGYGPPRVFPAADVRRISAALAALDEEQLRERFVPTEMMSLEIYPEVWDRDPSDEDTFEYLWEHFETLRVFISAAAERKLGLVAYFS